jgi:acyl carrier protein
MRYLEGEFIMNIQEQVLEGLKKVVNGKEVTLESNLKELGLDSLDVVDMLMDLEEKFGIEFENEEMMAFQVVNDIVKAIEKKTA